MTGEFKECDKLCGVRLLDKSKTGAENSFRIEVWTKFSSDNDEAGKIMKQYIEEVFCALIRECKDSIVKVNTANFAQHKTPHGNKGYSKTHSKWLSKLILV